MENKKFTEVVEKQLNLCSSLLLKKGEEYDSKTADRLHSFKIASAILNTTPKQVLAAYMAKHVVSIYDMCQGNEEYTVEKWDEKITDNINYLLLLRAMIEEEKQ